MTPTPLPAIDPLFSTDALIGVVLLALAVLLFGALILATEPIDPVALLRAWSRRRARREAANEQVS